MTTLILQTALLLLGAYFLGAWIGCLVKRTFFAETLSRSDDAAFATAGAASVSTAPGPSLGSSSAPTISPVMPPVRRPDPRPIAIETIERVAPQSAEKAANRFEEVLTRAPETTLASEIRATPPAPIQPPMVKAQAMPLTPTPAAPPVNRVAPAAPLVVTAPVVAAASAVAAKVVSVVAAPGATTAVQPVPMPVIVQGSSAAPVAPSVTAADDLTRIRSIDSALQSRLLALGARRYKDIAGWTTTDVGRFSKDLGFNGRIEQENWIEQAQILARGGETAYSRRRDRGETAPTANGLLDTTLAVATKAPMRPDGPATSAAVASMPTPLPRVAERAGFARTTPTVAASTVTAALPPALAVIAVPAPARPTPATIAPSTIAPGMEAATASAAAAGFSAMVGSGRDRLQRIGGINGEIEKLLNTQGVNRYTQIAGWSGDDIKRYDGLLGHPGRINRETWVEQAQILSRGGQTSYARQFDQRPTTEARADRPDRPDRPERQDRGDRPDRDDTRGSGDGPRTSRLADAIRDTTSKVSGPAVDGSARAADLAGLRSVRSEAYTQPGQTNANKSVQPDDLKRIRGVGVLIEKKLYSMGTTTYAQVANWSAADIDRVSQVLDFRGRIERENWVEQARILSAGGQTEFSRRVDRGDVETSRDR
jgi:predicted flap endonuclease-1-like 5' DNA nuclease